jgi:thiosulfate/3-mercaptopyruvate sulfurtransferase
MQRVFISTTDLQSLLDSNSVYVVDSGMNTKPQHFEKRIPGSRYFSISEIKNSNSSLSQEAPELEEFKGYMKRLGLKNDGKSIVVYDQTGFVFSGRAWFLLKHYGYPDVRILDGGLVKWVSEGRATASGEYDLTGNSDLSDQDYNLVEIPNQRIYYPDLKNLVQAISTSQTDAKVWDPRAPDLYNQGTVDTAVNIPIGTFFNPDKTVKPVEEVSKILQDRLGNTLTITSCTKGVAACIAYAILTYAGRENIRVYTGSFEEWKSLNS